MEYGTLEHNCDTLAENLPLNRCRQRPQPRSVAVARAVGAQVAETARRLHKAPLRASSRSSSMQGVNYHGQLEVLGSQRATLLIDMPGRKGPRAGVHHACTKRFPGEAIRVRTSYWEETGAKGGLLLRSIKHPGQNSVANRIFFWPEL